MLRREACFRRMERRDDLSEHAPCLSAYHVLHGAVMSEETLVTPPALHSRQSNKTEGVSTSVGEESSVRLS